MIRLTVGGSLLIILVAAAVLFLTPLAHAAQCAGQMVRASYYGKETCRYNPDPRCPTAGGVMHFDGSQLLAAHRTLPMGTRVRVTFNGRSIVVPILDRGPAKWTSKALDLSKAAARAIGFVSGKVCMERL